MNDLYVGMPLHWDGHARRESYATVRALVAAGATWDGPERGTLIAHQRNRIVEAACASGARNVLMLDADVSLADPVRSVRHMLGMDLPVVGAPYRRRSGCEYAAAVTRGREQFHVTQAMLSGRRGPYRCDWIGAGCMLIDIAALDALPENEPLFRHEWLDLVNGGRIQTGEDIGFCMHFRAHTGGPVYLDAGVRATHHTGRRTR